jgi:arabinogalactan endo-1,4-beta-galactosidase
MNVLLDFHYSDTWADPSKQIIPAAWEDIEDVNELGDELYAYTYDVLMELDSLGLMPESEILRPEGTAGTPIHWERNALLLNQAIRAVRDADAQSDESPHIMLHVAQPENVEGWLLAAQRELLYRLVGSLRRDSWECDQSASLSFR